MFEDLISIYDNFTKNERTQSLSRLAYENQLQFIKREPFGEQQTRLKEFKLFDKKGVKRLLGIIDFKSQERSDLHIRFYDFIITKDLETKVTSVVEIHHSTVNAGYFMIKPLKGLSKLFRRSRRGDLNSIFDKNFKTIPPISLSTQAMETLLENPKITVECREDLFIFYMRNQQIKISEVLNIIDFAEELVHWINVAPYNDIV
ncbi:hypothetical protein [Portibacter marinus]|uniref:hypothetical protein n=1 Tax=Portibacter marinus TaxID=2898660 RepID=UPI001F3B717C|nr:hypothetical protein [Portibacter marinus]